MGAEEALIDDDLYDDDLHGDYAEADIVEWYEARPVTLSTAAVTGAVVSAFALGALTAVGALFLIGRLDD